MIHRTAKAQCRGRGYNNNKKCDWGKKKQQQHLKSLVRFHSANKIYNCNEREEKNIQKHVQNKSKHKNNKCLSWVIAVLSLAGSHSPPHLPRMPSNTVLISRPAVGTAQILIWSHSCVFLPPMSTGVRTSVLLLFFFLELSVSFNIFHTHRLCLVDCVYLIGNL